MDELKQTIEERTINNEIKKKNLTPYQRAMLVLQLEDIIKSKAKENERINGRNRKKGIEKTYFLKNNEENNPKPLQIYIAKSENKLKVGLSKYPKSRMKNLQTGHPNIELLFTDKGNRKIESNIIKYFKEYSIGGEWFIYSPKLFNEIKEYIEKENKTSIQIKENSDNILKTSLKLTVHTRKELAKKSKISEGNIDKVKKIQEKANDEIKKQLLNDEITITEAYNKITYK
jgi:hypothetical protein